jgi:hypothetical protein
VGVRGPCGSLAWWWVQAPCGSLAWWWGSGPMHSPGTVGAFGPHALTWHGGGGSGPMHSPGTVADAPAHARTRDTSPPPGGCSGGVGIPPRPPRAGSRGGVDGRPRRFRGWATFPVGAPGTGGRGAARPGPEGGGAARPGPEGLWTAARAGSCGGAVDSRAPRFSRWATLPVGAPGPDRVGGARPGSGGWGASRIGWVRWPRVARGRPPCQVTAWGPNVRNRAWRVHGARAPIMRISPREYPLSVDLPGTRRGR